MATVAQEKQKDINIAAKRADSGGGSSPSLQVARVKFANAPAAQSQDHAHSPENQGAQQKVAVLAHSLGPDDEISTFFRNRQMIAQGSFGWSPFKFLFVSLVVITAGFVTAYNYRPEVRITSQNLAREHLGLSLAEYVPVWTKKAKVFRHQHEISAAAQPGGQARAVDAKISNLALSPLFFDVIAGNWPLVEAFNSTRCARWQPSQDCAVRAWYLSYRGMRASLGPLKAMDFSPRSKLPPNLRAIWLYAQSAAISGAPSESYFQQAMTVAGVDQGVRQMIFDARYKAILRDNNGQGINGMIQMIPGLRASPGSVEKWRALDYVTKMRGLGKEPASSLSPKVQRSFTHLGQSYPGVLKGDPVAFLMIGEEALRLGLAKQVGSLAGTMASESLKSQLDPSLRRGVTILAARALIIQGQLPAARERLRGEQSKGGSDSVGQHLLGSIGLQMRTAERITEAQGFFKSALKTRPNWQSEYGLLLALTRSGRLAEANQVASRLRSYKRPDNEKWVESAVFEYKIAAAKASGDMAPARYKEVSRELAELYARHPGSQVVAKLYAEALSLSGASEQAMNIQRILDDASSKTSYLSSPEFSESPVGPWALAK